MQGTAGGTPVERPLAAGLVTGDGATVYRVDDGIPVMLPGLGIAAGRLRRGWGAEERGGRRLAPAGGVRAASYSPTPLPAQYHRGWGA